MVNNTQNITFLFIDWASGHIAGLNTHLQTFAGIFLTILY